MPGTELKVRYLVGNGTIRTKVGGDSANRKEFSAETSWFGKKSDNMCEQQFAYDF